MKTTNNNDINIIADRLKEIYNELVEYVYNENKDKELSEEDKGKIFWLLYFQIVAEFKNSFTKKFGTIQESYLNYSKRVVLEQLDILNNINNGK